jgi:signal peptidase I
MSDWLTGQPVPDNTAGGDSRRSEAAAAPHGAIGDAPDPRASAPAGRARAGGGDESGRAAGGDRDGRVSGGDRDGRAAGGDQDGRVSGGDQDGRVSGGDENSRAGRGDPGGRAGRDDQDGRASPVAPASPGGAGSPHWADRRSAKSARRQRSFWRELPLLIIVALAIALLIKTFVVQAFFIPSGSMENTLEIGDKIIVNKLVYHFRSIQPGDIIVFDGAGSWTEAPASHPSSDPIVRAYDVTLKPLFESVAGLFGTAPGQTDFIKRVIGVPGDHVACCNAQGLVTVNGVPLHEQSYLHPGESPGEAPAGYSGRFAVTVPPGRLWVMGDNRAVSDDSRLRQNEPGRGTIPESAVVGRAFMIVWPPSRWRILPIPSTFGQPGIEKSAAAAAGSGAVRIEPAAPFLPLAAGFAGAVPLTLLQRHLRRRLRRVSRGA